MSVSIASSSFANIGSGTATSLTITAPASIVANNVLLAVMTTSAAVTLPSGWTALSNTSFSAPNFYLAFKVATSSEPANYTFTQAAGADLKLTILQLAGADTATPVNGFFGLTETTAAQTAGATTGTASIPTKIGCLPLALFTINQENPSNAGPPTALTSGWTQTTFNVWEDTTNYGNTSNANGYNATLIAQGPATSDTTTAVTSGATWGGAYSSFSPGTTVMLFINPVIAGTLSVTPSTLNVPGTSTSNSQQATVSQPNFTGNFIITVPTASQSVVSISATQTGTYANSLSLAGPTATFWVQEIAPGNYTVKIQGG